MSHKLAANCLPNLVRPMISLPYRQLFINNRFIDSICGKTLDVIDPRDESIITPVAQGMEEDMNIAIDMAHLAFEQGPWYNDYTGADRESILRRWADLIHEHMDQLVELESWEVGRPLHHTRNCILMGIKRIHHISGFADKACGSTLNPDAVHYMASTYNEPYGVIGCILPWNNPCVLFMTQVSAALAFGNTAVVKPAETSPLGALYLANLAAEAGVPEGVLNVVCGYGDIVGQALCRHEKVGKVSFTGESATGKQVMKTACDSLTPVTLELGGKSPLIIFPDAEIDVAAQVAHIGVFTNNGQVCCASGRVFVHESMYDEFVEQAVHKANQIKVGDNLGSEVVDHGPLQNQEVYNKVCQYIMTGKKQGATLKTGGERITDKGYFVQPTVFSDVQDDMQIATNEIFGPTMQILKYYDNVKEYEMGDVLRRANNTKFGLAAGIVTNDTNIIHRCRKRLQAGTVWVNCWHNIFPQTPFGGYKQSGFGRICGESAVENFTRVKTQTQAIL